MFQDRQEAGQRLARALERHRAAHPLVLGLPRGGVVVAAAVARGLGGDLDVLLVKKLRAPGNSELALGAVTEDGRVFMNDEIAKLTLTDARYVEHEVSERCAEMSSQHDQYRAVRPRLSAAGRTVILVDDGLATGATMIAGIQAVESAQPARLIVAVPVSPPDVARRIGQMEAVGEFVCLERPWRFQGVGQFYGDFRQVADETVIAILKEFA